MAEHLDFKPLFLIERSVRFIQILICVLVTSGLSSCVTMNIALVKQLLSERNAS